MSFRMTEKDQNEMLEKLLMEDEFYKAKCIGVSTLTTKAILKITLIAGVLGGALAAIGLGPVGVGAAAVFGALANEYGYIGLTEKRIVFNVVGKLNCSKVKKVVDIPLDSIEKVKVTSGLFNTRKLLKISYSNGKSITLSMNNKIMGSEFKEQRDNVEIIANVFSFQN